jgi:hypothetical protein
MCYSTCKVKSRVKYSQADFFYSSTTNFPWLSHIENWIVACSCASFATTTRDLGILFTYTAEGGTCITGNTCLVITIQPVQWRQLHGHTANTCHVTATYCVWRHCGHGKHSFSYCWVLDRVYRAVVWQRVDQICCNIFSLIPRFQVTRRGLLARV